MKTKSDLEVLAIIPARGGSKGIPKKNIHLLKGKPLIAYTIETALASKVVETVWVSTDSEEIAEVAQKYGARVIDRPEDLASDTASTESALIHVIETLKSEGEEIPPYILTLPATSPLRTVGTLQSFVDHFVSVVDKYDAMISLTENREDFWIKGKDGELHRLFPEAPRRRQDRQPMYSENSVIYITETEALLKTNSILGTRNTGFVIPEEEGLDINEPIDLLKAEFLLEQSQTK